VAKKKQRLDKELVDRGLVPTRAKGRALIMAGEVLVNGEMVDRPAAGVEAGADVRIKERMPYVSRGGFKLATALERFRIDVNGRVCADVGACTGGFTDVLLQQGAARVYAIDVGYGQLDWQLRRDDRVVVMERTNARYLETLPESVGFACVDVSFISLKLILPAVEKWVISDADIVALIKPQFEAGRSQVGKGGIVKDPAVHRQVVAEILTYTQARGLAPLGLVRSPIEGADGNVEFLAWLRPGGTEMENLAAAIERVTGRES
jgi:23S rRNA (cytidine1920-2'-O)/16S rRNA (cytidine1409-2'-O)-methyltransferase